MLTRRVVTAAIGILLVIIPVIIWVGGCSRFDNGGNQVVTTGEEPTREPEAKWEPIFFKIINERTAEANLPSLRSILLPDGDFEIRMWVGFGINGEDGLALRQSSGRWSALHLQGMGEHPPFVKTHQSIALPKSGWEAMWQRLVNAGVLELPDALAIGCSTHMFDGKSYVVEININKKYRTYLYDNPKHASCREAEAMLKIAEMVAEEFGLEAFNR